MLKKILYFFYYLKETDRRKFWRFLSFASTSSGRPRTLLLSEMLIDCFRFNISILDYFYFRFYEKSNDDKARYAGTGFMYEYQLRMNPPSARDVLADKIKFLRTYKQFVQRSFATRDALNQDPALYHGLINASGKIVVKGSKGQVGAEVQVIEQTRVPDAKALADYMRSNNFDLAEEYVIQHKSLMELSPSGLNTVRIITQVVNSDVHILAARLRITINSSVDNMAAGNAAAPIDFKTGSVSGPAVFSDVTKDKITTHPISGVTIQGLTIPYWQDIIQMVKKAALLLPQNRSVGWDVAVGENGPQLIEGNHNWCKLLWQLPVEEGLKFTLPQFK